jgi:ADP-ribosylglycohydrolase
LFFTHSPPHTHTKKMAASSFADLRDELDGVSPEQKRVVQSFLSLAIGDAAGLPFELSHGKDLRPVFDALPDEDKIAYVAGVVRTSTGNDKFARAYSDDTVCTDLKMAALAHAYTHDKPDLLFAFMMQQYLKWAYNGAPKEGSSHLFTGYGDYTENLLFPRVEVDLFDRDKDFGDFWPTEAFLTYASDYFSAKKGGVKSWGNGAVMSFVPQAVAETAPWRGKMNLDILASTHQEPVALLAASLMDALLKDLFANGSKASAKKVVFETWPRLPDLLKLVVDHECYPVAAFLEWLTKGDCTEETALAFLARLLGDNDYGPTFALLKKDQVESYGVFAAMLRVVSNFDVNNWVPGARNRTRLGSGEVIRFSQRALNTLFIAVWAVDKAKTVDEWLARVMYVGGDTDTVGAVAGQLAGPLMQTEDVLEKFDQFVCIPSGGAAAAGKRYFDRVLLFVQGNLKELARYRFLCFLDEKKYVCAGHQVWSTWIKKK